MILVVTCKQDSHADAVIQAFSTRGVMVFRLNTEAFLTDYRVNLGVDTDGSWKGMIEDHTGRRLDFRQVKVAWLRKPSHEFELTSPATPEVREFIKNESVALLQSLYSLPGIQWVNDPFIANKAKVKFQQLALAKSCGLKVPRTIITTDSEDAQTFFASCGHRVLAKAVYTNNVTLNGRHQGMSSRLVDEESFQRYQPQIEMAPVQLQEYVEKEFELRVTVMGSKVFAVKIDSQVNEETRVDWRVNTAINPHSAFCLPASIEDACVQLLRNQQLAYGAIDFIVTPNGEYVFLENNPFGQYLWLEQETGLPLTEEMCNLLVSYTLRQPIVTQIAAV